MSHHQRNHSNRAPANLNRRNRSDQQQQRRAFPFQRIRAPRPPNPYAYYHFCSCAECHPKFNRFEDEYQGRRSGDNDTVSNGGGLSDEELRRCVKVAKYRRSCDEGALCAICLDDLFQQEEHKGEEQGKGGDDPKKMIRVGLISKCGHKFHYGCIEMWLGRNNSCPLCKAAVKPLSDAVIKWI